MKHFFLLSDFKRSDKKDPGKGPTPSEEISEPLYPYEHDINTSDGSEFLDDAIRMKDQPLGNSQPVNDNPNETKTEEANKS